MHAVAIHISGHVATMYSLTMQRNILNMRKIVCMQKYTRHLSSHAHLIVIQDSYNYEVYSFKVTLHCSLICWHGLLEFESELLAKYARMD